MKMSSHMPLDVMLENGCFAARLSEWTLFGSYADRLATIGTVFPKSAAPNTKPATFVTSIGPRQAIVHANAVLPVRFVNAVGETISALMPEGDCDLEIQLVADTNVYERVEG